MKESTVEKLDIKPTANDRLTRRQKVVGTISKKTEEVPEREPEYKAHSTEAAATTQAQHKFDNLELRTRKNGVYIVPYDLIRLIHMPTPQLITLYCIGYVFTIEGDDLDELRKALGTRKAAYVQEFNVKGIDKLPEGTPVVHKINIQFGKPQEEGGIER